MLDSLAVSAVVRPHYDGGRVDALGARVVAGRDFEVEVGARSSRYGPEVSNPLVREIERRYYQGVRVSPAPGSDNTLGSRIKFGSQATSGLDVVGIIERTRSRGAGERVAGALQEVVGRPRVKFRDHTLADRLRAAGEQLDKKEDHTVQIVKLWSDPEPPQDTGPKGIVWGPE
jgi:hypothetical protein